MILNKVRDWIVSHGLIQNSNHILAACSGGADSLVLVDLLFRLQAEMQFSVSVAHFNHQLRGEESHKDAEYVADFCQQRKLPFFIGQADVAAERKKRGGSIEAVARELRYDYLGQLAARVGADCIMTGHHLDDQAETVLLNLLRGSGGKGLGAVKVSRGMVVRPLLCLNRQEIEEYCNQRKIMPRYDQSNSDVEYMRNRIRHELIPFLQRRFNPSVVQTLCRTADVLQAEHQFLRDYTLEKMDELITQTIEGFCFSKKDFLLLATAVQRELLRGILEKLRGESQGISFIHVEKIRGLVSAERGSKQLRLPGRIRTRKVYDQIYLEKVPAELCKAVDTAVYGLDGYTNTVLECPGKTVLPGFGIEVVSSIRDDPFSARLGLSKNQAVFDLEKLTGTLSARRRLPGDVFRPLGARGHRKLKNLLIDLKVPREQREKIPIISDEEGILWVAGLRRTERAKLSENTRRCLVLEIRPWSGEESTESDD